MRAALVIIIGNLQSLTDAEQNQTTWTYDVLNRPVTETNSLGHSRLFTCDVASRLTEKTDRNGRVTKYSYDDADRRTSERWYADASDPTADHTLDFTYYHAGRLLSSGDTHHDYLFRYDALGRMTTQQTGITGLADDVVLYHAFDAANRKVTDLRWFGDLDTATTYDHGNIYEFDNLHRQSQVTQKEIGGGHAVSDKHVDFSYDLAGQLETATRFSTAVYSSGAWQGSVGTEVATSEYVFDQAGRLDTLKHHQGATTGGTLLAGYDFDFSVRNHLDAIDFLPTQYNAEDVDYSYDDRGQLEGADQSGTTNDESYTYDENGNRVTANGSTYATGDDNRLASDGTYTYEYDNEGNRVKRTEIATGEYTEYEWDHRNRLVRVVDKNASGVPTQAVDHAYDAENQWIRRTVDTDGDGDIDEQTVFVHDDNQIVMQFDDTGTADLTKDDLSHRYLWGAAVDQLLADEEVNSVTNASLNETLWALTDHLGTVRDLVDDSGVVQNHISYDSFGNVTTETNSAVDTVFGFTGKALDESTGLQNNWNRWYDASVGRWVSQDPIGFEAGDANVYRYVGNHGVLLTDASGLAPTQDAVVDPPMVIGIIEDIEKEFPNLSPGDILDIYQNRTTYGFLSQFPGAKELGLVDDPPSRKERISWHYIYSEKHCWIDMGHFLVMARQGRRHPDKLDLLEGLGRAYEDYTEREGARNPLRPGFGSSANTPEDLESNRLGLVFGSGLRNDHLLSKQFAEFFNQVGAKPGNSAWNYPLLPPTEKVWEQCWQRNPTKAMNKLGTVMNENSPWWKKYDVKSKKVRDLIDDGWLWGDKAFPPRNNPINKP